MPLDFTQIFAGFLTLIVAPLTAVVTWRLSKRKNTAEADSVIVSGANQAVDTMITVLAELRDQVFVLQEEAHALREENQELRRQVRELKNEVKHLKTGR